MNFLNAACAKSLATGAAGFVGLVAGEGEKADKEARGCASEDDLGTAAVAALDVDGFAGVSLVDAAFGEEGWGGALSADVEARGWDSAAAASSDMLL